MAAYLASTRRWLTNALEQAQVALQAAEAQHAEPLAAARAGLAEALQREDELLGQQVVTQQELAELQQARDRVKSDTAPSLATAIAEAEDKLQLLQEPLQQAVAARQHALQVLREVQRPFQFQLDMVETLTTTSQMLEHESNEVATTIAEFQRRERANEEAWERERHKCRYCNDQPGGCSHCDPLR